MLYPLKFAYNTSMPINRKKTLPEYTYQNTSPKTKKNTKNTTEMRDPVQHPPAKSWTEDISWFLKISMGQA
jgi:hypothetical protein